MKEELKKDSIFIDQLTHLWIYNKEGQFDTGQTDEQWKKKHFKELKS